MGKDIQAKDINLIDIIKAVKTIQTVRKEDNYSSKTPIPYIADFFPNIPEKVVIAKLNSILKQGYIEFGGNIRGCWLTPEGEKLLENVK